MPASMTRRAFVLNAAAVPLAMPKPAIAQSGFPSRPIRIVIGFPPGGGIDIIARMRGDPALKAIPVMAVTAYAGQEDEARIRAAGANAYVTKPISVMRFVEEVQGLL